VIAVDTNVLVAAHRRDAEGHEAAAARVRELAEGLSAWAIPAPCLHEFLAVVTHPRIFDPPSRMQDALAQVEAWMASPSLAVIGESDRHWQTLPALLKQSKVAGPQVHEARVAAICLDHGVGALLSADRDFGRFRGLRTENPLRAGRA
jgi:toxin-antitoxin system PIN domain toxin